MNNNLCSINQHIKPTSKPGIALVPFCQGWSEPTTTLPDILNNISKFLILRPGDSSTPMLEIWKLSCPHRTCSKKEIRQNLVVTNNKPRQNAIASRSLCTTVQENRTLFSVESSADNVIENWIQSWLLNPITYGKDLNVHANLIALIYDHKSHWHPIVNAAASVAVVNWKLQLKQICQWEKEALHPWLNPCQQYHNFLESMEQALSPVSAFPPAPADQQ